MGHVFIGAIDKPVVSERVGFPIILQAGLLPEAYHSNQNVAYHEFTVTRGGSSVPHSCILSVCSRRGIGGWALIRDLAFGPPRAFTKASVVTVTGGATVNCVCHLRL